MICMGNLNFIKMVENSWDALEGNSPYSHRRKVQVKHVNELEEK